ncbi:MAG TPA: tetratricopeptide repeat protein [Pyrinomonadaceae bacterium]|nr:tetratricopeptide repeat protein [Pyrinomonadaceae bacterium]
MTGKIHRAIALSLLIFSFSVLASAQSGSVRPRRVNPPPSSTAQTSDAGTLSSSEDAAPRLGAANRPSSSPNTSGASGDTSRAFSLFQQKQYAAAAREAKQIAASDPNNAEAWKIAGFSEMNLKQYPEAADDLRRALELQRREGKEDTNTADALAQALVFTEKFEEALPLLVAATSRKGAQADPAMLYYRGLSEFQTNKRADAERSFGAAVKANPKDARSLYYLGQIAFERNDMDAAIAALNRATLNDAQIASAWQLLTIAYLRRAGAATVKARADADYLSAVRAGEALVRARSDAATNTLLGQALIGAGQLPRAATILERAAADKDAKGGTFYLLGFTYSRSKNYPKAITALERAAELSPDDANVYRELGYAYEISKQYEKALGAYQKGARLAPDDEYFKQSVERVKQ